jgi:hypothetical protein
MKKTISLYITIIILMPIITYYVMHEKPQIPNVDNQVYVIGDESYTVIDGKSGDEVIVFGKPAYGDLDRDGDTDAAVYIVNQTSGTGIFYYGVLVINNNGQYRPTNSMFLGDRIAPQNVEIHDGRAVYNFADRRADEPMSVEPSHAKSVWVNYDASRNEIGEWVKDFEGETR